MKPSVRSVNELTEVQRQQRDKDRLELEKLSAKAAAWDALAGEGDGLLVKVAHALMLGGLMAHPLQAAQSDGDRVMRTDPTQSDPGASTRMAREQDRRLRKNLLDAVDRFQHTVDYWNTHGRFPPRVRQERMRCKTRTCPGKDVPLPLHYAEACEGRCLACGNRLYAA